MTRSYYVEVACRATAIAGDLEEHLDEVMEALEREPGIEDADIGADLSEGLVDFCLHLDAEDAGQALVQAHIVVRSALHAAGGRTPDWESVIQAIADDQAETTVRPSELVAS